MNRSAGILMPIFSLPSPYGIGTMGQAARDFLDFLEAGGQSYWQLLPVGPTSYGDSPYQSFSSFAGNPYFIDLDSLAADGLLEPNEYQSLSWGDNPEQVDYGLMYETRYPVLRRAAARLLADPPAEYGAFCRDSASPRSKSSTSRRFFMGEHLPNLLCNSIPCQVIGSAELIHRPLGRYFIPQVQ